jgi:hypothetical protein
LVLLGLSSFYHSLFLEVGELTELIEDFDFDILGRARRHGFLSDWLGIGSVGSCDRRLSTGIDGG